MTVEDLKKYKTSLYSGLSSDLAEFEKNFLLISAGTFTVSITFIKDIVKIDSAKILAVLIVSWLLMASAVAIIMYAFLVSVNASNKLWKTVDDFMIQKQLFLDNAFVTDEDSDTIKTETNKLLYDVKSLLKNMRLGAITCFVLGLLCFGIFISYNLVLENQKPVIVPLTKGNKTVVIKSKDTFEISTSDSEILLKLK